MSSWFLTARCVIIFCWRRFRRIEKVVISFMLLGNKVSFGLGESDIVTGLRFRLRYVVDLQQDKALRLRRLYIWLI